MTQRHSDKILAQLYEYDSFLDSLRVVADMGCGDGHDILWWATLTTRDDPPKPHNYKCYAVDKNPANLNKLPDLPNLFKYERDFTNYCIPIQVDLMWSHDSLQYSHNPLETLKIWNTMMNVNGMLVICVPMHTGVADNRFYSRSHSGCYYHFTPVNLIYMLAVNGFDCRDAYLLKQFGDTWLHMAVYKSDVAPMDPATTTWLDLIDKNLLHPTVVNSINTYGYLRQEDILYPWLDRENYFVDWIPQPTEIPEGLETKVEGVFNTSAPSEQSLIKQAPVQAKGTTLAKPVGVLRPPKKRYD